MALLDLQTDGVDVVVAEMDSQPAVDGVEVLGRATDQALVQFETTAPLLLTAMEAAGVPLELPIEIVDGAATTSVTVPREQLSRLVAELEAHGVGMTVRAVHRDVADDSPLTDRQRHVLEAAVEQGYYDTPRSCSLTDLAARLDVAKSTCSETLHRAEAPVVKEFLAETR